MRMTGDGVNKQSGGVVSLLTSEGGGDAGGGVTTPVEGGVRTPLIGVQRKGQGYNSDV